MNGGHFGKTSLSEKEGQCPMPGARPGQTRWAPSRISPVFPTRFTGQTRRRRDSWRDRNSSAPGRRHWGRFFPPTGGADALHLSRSEPFLSKNRLRNGQHRYGVREGIVRSGNAQSEAGCASPPAAVFFVPPRLLSVSAPMKAINSSICSGFSSRPSCSQAIFVTVSLRVACWPS